MTSGQMNAGPGESGTGDGEAPVLRKRPRNRFESLFRGALQRCGIDRATGYTLVGKGWTVAAGPVTVFLVARFLRPDQQGFYYTFGSVLGLNIFFELGLAYVLLQFASHEKAHLEWTTLGSVAGSETAQIRLAALLKLAMRWYGVAASLVIFIILPTGIFLFSRNYGISGTVVWRAPWVWLTIASALDLLISPLLAVLEGCGKVAQIASMRVGQNVLSTLGLWLGLVFHGALFSVAIDQTLNVVIALAWIVFGYRRFFTALAATDVAEAPFNWRAEVWPFQWRIAFSWLSGYFIFQLFNPVLFATHGAVVAGQMGMSVVACNALFGVAAAWMNTKTSPFGVLVAKHRWNELDSIFFRTLAQSTVVLIIGAIAGFCIVVFLDRYYPSLGGRLLPPGPFACVLGATILNYAIFSQTQYVRTHKTEPFLSLSIVMALLTGASTIILAGPFGALGVAAGYLGCRGIAAVWTTRIFIQKRREWHV